MGTSQRSKGSYHERWWVKWFETRGAKAERQPLSGQLGGKFAGDIQIETPTGVLIAESKYQAKGRGFSFLTTTHNEQPADIYLLKQKSGPNFICVEASNPLATKIIGWIAGRQTIQPKEVLHDDEATHIASES
jgi:hypothetical protein